MKMPSNHPPPGNAAFTQLTMPARSVFSVLRVLHESARQSFAHIVPSTLNNALTKQVEGVAMVLMKGKFSLYERRSFPYLLKRQDRQICPLYQH
jgi:hypothetical protein